MNARLYRWAVRAFPRRHRDRYAAEMVEAFERALEAKRRSGLVASATFVVAAVLNAIVTGCAERRRWHVVRVGYAFSHLDIVLAWRMLVRFPGLSLVSLFGLAVGIGVATMASVVVTMLLDTRLPLPEGERIVSFVTTDTSATSREARLVHDYASWREMASMEVVGVNQEVTRTLVVAGQAPEPVTIAQISASAFRVAGVGALRGRVLLPEDEAPGAADVVLIGFDEWVGRFGSDPDVVGRALQLGTVTYVVVGVMPEGFGFPVNHTWWIPWRVEGLDYLPRTGPPVAVYGRLASGATLDSAQAELTTISRRLAAASPTTHQHLLHQVVPYVYAFTDMGRAENFLVMRAIELSVVMLLIVVCVNVGILIYARTATRGSEIAVRTALGASRRRIVGQLFVEALVLTTVAALIGVSLVSIALPHLEAGFLGIIEGRLPFWLAFDLTPRSAAWVVGCALLGAGIVGVLPALKATRSDTMQRLQAVSAGGGSRMELGGMWTLLIVAQVALSVALLPTAMVATWDGLRPRGGDAGFGSGAVIEATLTMDRAQPLPASGAGDLFPRRLADVHADVDRGLRAEPGVADVTFSLIPPGEEWPMVLTAEGLPVPSDPVPYNIQHGSTSGHLVRYNRVAVNFFDAYDVPMVLGRDFSAADTGRDHVIINRTLAGMTFGTASPLGRRVKYVGRSHEVYVDDDYLDRVRGVPATVPLEHWFEVVGVVSDFPDDRLDPVGRVYHPVALGAVYPIRLGVRVGNGEPADFTARLRQVVAAVSLDLQVQGITTASIRRARDERLFQMMGTTVGLVMLSVLALVSAGIHSLIAFTVVRRRREIGIRTALGADAPRLLRTVFSRVARQLGLGAALGILGAIVVDQLADGGLRGRGAVVLPLVALVMTVVGVMSAVGPALDGLRIQPTEALRED